MSILIVPAHAHTFKLLHIPYVVLDTYCTFIVNLSSVLYSRWGVFRCHYGLRLICHRQRSLKGGGVKKYIEREMRARTAPIVEPKIAVNALPPTKTSFGFSIRKYTHLKYCRTRL